MTPERWRKIDEIFDRMLDCAPHDRETLLAEYCGADEELRREVEALLAAHEQAPEFIEKPPLTEMQSVLANDALRPASLPKMSEMIGQTLGHYRLNALLGAGGMGEVYRALDTRLDREVAVKVLTHKLALNPEALKRFEREAKAVAALSHPNILAIHDFGVDGETSYAVTELLKGETLRERLTRSNLSQHEIVEIAVQIAEGLSAAHAQGIIHRDLKPENIFLTTAGVVKILDFGIARIKPSATAALPAQATTISSVTAPGRIIGTIGYMSPEQVRGEAVDAPSDIFAFGCVFFEMLFGTRPFARATTAETMAAILRDDPLPVSEKDLTLPVALKRLLLRCLAKHPADRYQSARDLVVDLKSLPAPAATSRLQFLKISKRTLVLLLAGLLLSLMIGLYFKRWKPEAAINSLAVLPLVSIEPDAQVESLAEGVVEGIITQLSQLPDLRVMARSTVFKYKDQAHNPQAVGQQLKVQAVLTGRIVRKGESIAISTELVNVADGSLLWGEKYDRPLTDLTPLQSEIAERVSDQLHLSIKNPDHVRLRKRSTKNNEAYQLYLYGRYQLNKRTDESILKSIEYFKQAIAKDSAYALAYAGLADAYFLGSGNPGLPRNEAMPQAKTFAEKAVGLDANSSEAQTSLAMIRLFYDYDWVQAERGFQRAIECNAGYVTAHHWYGILLYALGRFAAAQQELRIAKDLDPLSLPLSTEIGLCHYFAREYDQAIAQFQQTLELDPQWLDARRWLAGTYFQQRRESEAIAEYLKIAAMSGEKQENIDALRGAAERDSMRGYWQARLKILSNPARINSVSPFNLASLNANLGNKEEALMWLEKAFAERINGTREVSGLLYLKVDPRFDLLRRDVRFAQLLQTISLSPQ
ncbi:MAG: protein kinase [Acidobacteria bacterium]|nr:protein kinase [Acidobacteriota bacterium]